MSTRPLSPFSETDAAKRMKDDFLSWREVRTGNPTGERSGRELSEASAKVYQEMWFAFADYCGIHGLSLENLSQREIITFLDLRSRGEGRARMLPKGDALSPRYAWRMLTLIDRITCFTAEREGRQPNRGARQLLELPEYRYANAREKDPQPEYYAESQAQHLIQYLSDVVPNGDRAVRVGWKEVRDRTAVALMLGGGLAPGDIRAATIGGLITSSESTPGLPWKISLPGNGNAPARETPIDAWAGALLAHWLEVRANQDLPGDVLLPSTLSGKALSHAACYKVCKAILAAAGMDGDNGGIFKLRHTFALRQLANGKSEVDVARWLGLVDLNGMARYRKVVTQPVNLV